MMRMTSKVVELCQQLSRFYSYELHIPEQKGRMTMRMTKTRWLVVLMMRKMARMTKRMMMRTITLVPPWLIS